MNVCSSKSFHCAILLASIVVMAMRTAGAQESLEDIYLLSVGISKYSNPVDDVPGPATGATWLRNILQEQNRLAGSQLLVDEQATIHEIRQALKELQFKVRLPELLIVYLSAHGSRSAGHWRLSTHDGKHLIDEEVVSALRPIVDSGQRVLLVVESCYSGHIVQAAEDLLQNPKGKFLLFTSSVSSQTSVTSDCPYFTRAFLEGLSGCADANRDHQVTIAELRRYLKWRLNELLTLCGRLPGIPAKDQNFEFDISTSYSDSSILTIATNGPKQQLNFQHVVKGEPTTGLKRQLVGKWSTDPVSLSGSLSKIDRHDLTLIITESDRYTAVFSDTDGQVVRKGSGTVVYHATHVELVYESGSDCISIICADYDKNELEISFGEVWRTGDSEKYLEGQKLLFHDPDRPYIPRLSEMPEWMNSTYVPGPPKTIQQTFERLYNKQSQPQK